MESQSASVLRPRLRSIGGRASGLSVDSVVTTAAFTICALMVFLPLGFLLFASVQTKPPGVAGSSFTLEHWQSLFSGENLILLRNTHSLAAVATAGALALGVFFAWLTERTDTPGRSILRILFVLPILVSPLFTGLAYTILAGPRAGWLNVIGFRLLGLEEPILNIYSFAGITLVLMLHFVPFVYLLVSSSFESIDPSFEEASRILGAGTFRTLWSVVLPLLAPAIISAGILVFVLANELFSVPALLGPTARIFTLQYSIYSLMTDYPTNPNLAAAMGSYLLVLAAAGLWLYQRQTRHARRYVTVTGKATKPRLTLLGLWRWPLLVIGVVYLLLAVFLPYLALIGGSLMRFVTPDITWDLFTLNGYRENFARTDTASAFQNSLWFGVAGATLAVLFAILLSFLIVRTRSRLTRTVEFVAMMPLAVPALSLALGILWTFLYLPLGAYGTPAILIIAYVTRFTSYGIRFLAPSLAQIDPELEEASRIIGASRLTTLRHITVPLLRRAALAAWVLLFSQIIVEISLTSILFSSTSTTAAMLIWRHTFAGSPLLAYSLSVILATFGLVVILGSNRLVGTLRYARRA